MEDINRIRRFILMLEVNVTLILFLNGCSVFIPPNLYPHGAIDLEVKATIQFPDINESSALVKSRQFDDVYWTLNDSGDRARIFAIRKNGSIVKPEDSINYHGLSVTNAGNIDWEDMAVDNNGNLYIAAFGNNKNVRQDLSVYILPEPDPFKTDNAQTSAQIRFHYPDQHKFPPVKHNFDSEALFVADGKLYLLTKHRADTFTKLYRFDGMDADENNELTMVDKFDVGGMVTAADATPDGLRLAVLTYNSIWLFEIESAGQNYFTGKKYNMPIMAEQCEAICFDGESVIITNEQRAIFQVTLDRIKQYPVK